MIEQLQNMISAMDPMEVAQTTGIIAAVGTVINAATRGVLNAVTTWYHSRIKTYVITARAQIPATLKEKISFHCLIVRYGTDQYIEKMASEIDRQNGQLQNRILNVKSSGGAHGSETEFTLALPVHRRLGTQFKCFVDARKDALPKDKDAFIREVKKFLESSKIATDISTSSSEHHCRVYFLLSRFAAVETVDGFQNNHCFPE